MSRLLSLWGLVNQLDLGDFADLVARLERLATILENLSEQGGQGGRHEPGLYKTTLEQISRAVAYARNNGFQESLDTLAASESHLRDYRKKAEIAALATEAAHSRDALMIAAQNRKFLRVALSRADYVDSDALLGSEVYGAFESARSDIREAGNCLAADCNTAAVFHLMRAVEWGMRALCVDLGVRKLRTRNKKTGKISYKLIEFSEWETILNTLQERVDRKLAKVKRGPKKQLYQEFYYPVLQDIRGIREAWRNHTMHTRREYTASDADAILDHVKRLMIRLATQVSEV
jgi:hypothetical protein